MTTTIGVYDSGIGGLTTLSVLMRRFPACGFCYYADNARMPFGTKSADEVKRAVNTALSKMSGECSRLVLGCNTASVTANPDGVFKLRPRLENFSPATTLVLATPLTLAGLRAKEKGFMTADTRELAVLVEITASLKCKSRLRPDMSGLVGYLKEKLPPCGVERVVLGCSHYIYLAEQIAALYPDVPVCDGNADLLKEIAESVFPEKLSENSGHYPDDRPGGTIRRGLPRAFYGGRKILARLLPRRRTSRKGAFRQNVLHGRERGQKIQMAAFETA